MIEDFKISAISEIYFIGIGGIGMSALARYFNNIKVKVSGYDKVETTLTRKLVDEGIEIHYEDDPNLVPSSTQLVIFTPAIPSDHKELNHCKSINLPVLKRSQVLGLLSKEKRAIAVAGTHGKTSTSSIITHSLTYSGKQISAFIGGIMKNFNSNFVHGDSDWIVVEADEYDRSFLTLEPEISVLISVDPDHLDIYDDHETMIGGFKSFLKCTKHGGRIIIHEDVFDHLGSHFVKELKNNYEVVMYGEHVYAETFDQIKALDTHFFSANHNVENAIVAYLIAEEMDVDKQKIFDSLRNFEGIKRRFEMVYKTDQYCFIDDYAHHPTEIEKTVAACKEIAGKKKVTGIFQPHLFSRTRDFADGFAKALSKLDVVILLDIYPARELPISGISSNIIFENIETTKFQTSKSNLIEVLKAEMTDFILTIGAGDIDTCVPEIKRLLEKIDGNKK